MKIHVLNKRTFDSLMVENNINDDNVENRDSVFFISIVDTYFFNPFGDGPESQKWVDQLKDQLDHYFKKDYDNVINLEFDDCDHDGQPSPTNVSKQTKAFSKKQAETLFQFIKKHREKETCVVHCMAGISRSGAVGSFINNYIKGDRERFERNNPQILPNGRVLRMLNEVRYDDLED